MKEEDITVEIPPEVLEGLNKIPDRSQRYRKIVWEPWEDAVLLTYWGVKRHRDISKLLKKSQNTCLERYRHLTGGEE